MINLSHRSSAPSLESTTLGYKTFSTLNMAPVIPEFVQPGKDALPSLKSRHKKTRSDLIGAMTPDRVMHKTTDQFMRNEGSVSHRNHSTPKRNVGELNFKKLSEPFPNSSLRSSMTMRGTSSMSKSKFHHMDSYFDVTPPQTAMSPGLGTSRGKEKEDLSYVRQEELIKKNPHFHKFNECLHTLDKAETIKFAFSKEFFWSAAQVEFNEKMLKSIVKRRSRIEQEVRVLKENVKEQIQLLQGKTCYLKVRCEDKLFPLQVKITEKVGTFEALVSKTENILSRREYDYIFSTNEFRIHYDYTDSIKFLYFAITAIERLKMNITISFSPAEEKKKKPMSRGTLVGVGPKERTSHKKSTYEFFREEMRNDEFLELKELADDIKKEKRMRSLSLANNKDLVQENIQTARQYQEIKTVQLNTIFEKREHLLKRNRENKVLVKIEKDKQALINAYKFKIKRIEMEWKENEERKRQEKMRYQKNWLVSLAVSSIIKNMLYMKRAQIIVRIFEKQRETKVIKIQRLVRRFLARPVVMKSGEDKYLLNNLNARFAIRIFEALNGIAMIAHRSKTQKAANLAAMTLELASVPDGIVRAFEKYNNTVIMIQNRWRGQMAMFHAKIQVFLAVWDQFCFSLVTKEMKKKKKRYTDIIPLIKPARVEAYAKQFIQERITQFLRELREYKNKVSSDENSDDAQSVQLDKTFRETEHGESFMTRRNSITKKEHEPPLMKKSTYNSNKPLEKAEKAEKPKVNFNKGPHQLKLFKQLMKTPAKPKLKAKPTEEELRDIFEKFYQEVKPGDN